MLYRDAVHPATLELLMAIMENPALSGFYLAGGTSLALQLGHRLSFALDFFGKRPFEVQEILDEVHVLASVKILAQSPNILVLNIRDVKVDFVNYRYAVISPPGTEEGIRFYTLPDIAAMKLAAIAGRGRKRDFFDLFFLLRQYSLPEMLAFYLQKYDDGSDWMVIRSLTYFDDADQDSDVVLLKEKVDWSYIKRTLLAEVARYYS